jgi:pimeloyl-ACP methyl ester carboxylesterase
MVKFASTPLLEVGYLESGPPQGFPVILVHGWPDCALTWNRVTPLLVEAGFRVIAPYLRGYGPTRFLSEETPRSGQLVALGDDLVEFAKALGLTRYAVVGHDWGARAAYIASALAPDQITHCVGLSVGYGTNSATQALSLTMTQNYWYHWLMATPRGEREIHDNRRAFTRHIWKAWLPFWKPDDAELDLTLDAFENPDWAAIVLHSYTVRWGHSTPFAMYAALESRFDPAPKLTVPTLTLHGADDPVNAAATSEGKEGFFAGPYRRHVIEQCGHFPQREHADEVAQQVIAWLRS